MIRVYHVKNTNIHEDGKIRGEKTYPKSSGPKASRR